jgi:hypothetical protein
MVLHDIADDAKLIEVTTAALGAKGLFEDNLHAGNVMSAPVGAKELVSESEDEQVLDHLLTKVVVDTVDFFLFPIWLERSLKLSRAFKVFAKGLLNLYESVVSAELIQH